MDDDLIFNNIEFRSFYKNLSDKYVQIILNSDSVYKVELSILQVKFLFIDNALNIFQYNTGIKSNEIEFEIEDDKSINIKVDMDDLDVNLTIKDNDNTYKVSLTYTQLIQISAFIMNNLQFKK